MNVLIGIISIILLLAVLRYIFQYIFGSKTPSILDRKYTDLYYGNVRLTQIVSTFERKNYLDTNTTLHYENDFALCSLLCSNLETQTAEYIKHPIILDKTEVWKFCVILVGIEASLGDERDKTIRNLLSHFMEIQKFFLKAGRPHCYNFFQESWLLTECEALFGKSYKEILEKIRQTIDNKNYLNDNTEICYQLIYPYKVSKWLRITSSDYRVIFNNRYASLSYMQRNDRYANIFWYTYEEEPSRVEYLQRTYRDRDKALKTYLKCLKDVLLYTCCVAINKLPLSSITSENERESTDIPPIHEHDPNSGEPDLMPEEHYTEILQPIYIEKHQESATPHRELHQTHELPQPIQTKTYNTADTLIDIGLAHIGRKTVYENQYMTPEQADERYNIEHQFIQALAQTFTDEKTRSGLSRHFMLYKEFTLFVIFAMVLKKNKELHTKIQVKLKRQLSVNLPTQVIRKRSDYWRKLSQKFHESYTRTHDFAGTLEYTFWSTLPENIKSKGIFGKDSLHLIFQYSYNAVKQKYHSFHGYATKP